uniref:Uncharacterized protein n=1 Tax=Plectus sambesii TaxID=2011161 RepID=A0A914VSF6_9BILA
MSCHAVREKPKCTKAVAKTTKLCDQQNKGNEKLESTSHSAQKTSNRKERIAPVQKKNPPRGFMWLKKRTPGTILAASPLLERSDNA